ncbi:InlB B-repeat-containing protein [Tenacibaculum sp. 190524A05c]|uniref:InlB B-repeat-containing protein n=1 Tax=Tenacibaculum platacis TaxID=3137852 RepID=UPI0032B10A5B
MVRLIQFVIFFLILSLQAQTKINDLTGWASTTGFEVVNDYAYGKINSTLINKVDVTTTNATGSNLNTSANVNLDQRNLYANSTGNYLIAAGQSRIVRFNLTNNTVNVFFPGKTIITVFYYNDIIHYISKNSNNNFCEVYRYENNTSTKLANLNVYFGSVIDSEVDGDTLYVANNQTGNAGGVYKLDLSQPNSNFQTVRSNIRVNAISVYGDQIYFLTDSSNLIRRISKDGSGFIINVFSVASSFLIGVDIEGSNLFLATTNGLFRYTLPPLQYQLTINSNGGNVTTNPSAINNTYNEGTDVTLTATPDAGYQFDGWSGDATGTTNPLTITMDADKTVTAMFSKIQRTLTINAANGSVSTNPNPTGGTYDDGTSVELTAIPDAGYQFDGWSGDASGTANPLNITMDADKTVTAMFSKIHRSLTINATNGSVSTNPNPIGGTYDDGTLVELTATPDAGYQFDGWSGDASGTANPLTITMDADKTVTAMFSPVTASIVDEEFNKGIKVYPIPASNSITVDMLNGYEIKRIVVHNILGKEIIETKELKIDLSNLVKGIYVLKITNSDGRIATRRIIKN